MGWNGAGALTRELRLSEDGHRLEQRVIPEVESLRRSAEPLNAAGSVTESGVFELFADERETLSLVVPVCTGGCRIDAEWAFEQLGLWEYDTGNVFRCYDD